MPRLISPIAEKILRMVNGGFTTKEKICVATKLKYPSFCNIFKRPKVSTTVLLALLHKEIITEKEYQDYLKWEAEHGLNKEGRGGLRRRRKNGHSTRMDQESKHQQSSNGSEGEAQ